MKEGGVGLVDNQQYESLVPESVRTSLDALYEKVASGEIVAISALQDQDAWVRVHDEAAKPVE